MTSVLLIEDDDWFAEQQARILEAAGYEVRHVTNGLAAIEAIDDKLPAVIILDMFLPGPNALALLHEMQSYVDSASIPVVLCTSSASDISKGQLSAYGVHRILDKASMQPIDLVAAVKGALL